MEKDSTRISADHAEHPITVDSAIRRASVVADNAEEHQLTFVEVWKHHKAMVWWCFYFAMCAVGW
jgi:hypothetical protein